MLVCFFVEESGHGIDKGFAGAGKELDSFFTCLVAAQQPVFFVKSAAVDGPGQDAIETQDMFRTGAPEQPFCPFSRVDIAGQNTGRVVQDGQGVVGQDNLGLAIFTFDDVAVEFDVVDTGEGVTIHSE